MSVLSAFDDGARRVVVLAQDAARMHGASEVGLEHLLAGLFRVEEALTHELLREAGLDDVSRIPGLELLRDGAQTQAGDRPVAFSADVRRNLEAALREAAQLGSSKVFPEHILLALTADPSDPLRFLAVSSSELRSRLVRAMAGISKPTPAAVGVGARSRRPDGSRVLDRFGRDLTAAAADGLLMAVSDRDAEIDRLCQVLARQLKSNPLLVGDPGVGKTALVEGLALRIADGTAPDFLLERRLVQLDVSALVAGTRYRGDFEERIRSALEEAVRDPSILLFVDEMHVLVGAGAAEGAVDAASILKPLLARGEIQLIGATTFEEYRRHIAKDSALERRFQVLEVSEPDAASAERMLGALIPRLSSHHGVEFAADAAAAAVRLAHRYIPDRRLPDKALDLLDEAAARIRSSPAGTAQVDGEAVAETLSAWTGIPVASLSGDESARLADMEEQIALRLVGQEDAVSAVSRAVRRSRTGLKDPGRPAGSFLFAGPSGVGKTELAKALASFLFGSDDALIRFDMSEYQEKHTVSRLIGSPPGYVGHDEGGQLTEAVRRRPYCVLLLDEVEKAHPDVFNLLLQVLEEGSLTDAQGRRVDFRNTILVLTSNLGTDQMASLEVGFAGSSGSSYERMRRNAEQEIARFFRPELRNRMDEMVVFAPLTLDQVVHIAENMVDELSARMAERGFSLSVSEDFVRYMAEEGYDEEMGARPLRRVVQSLMADRIADLLVAGELASASTISFTLAAGEPDVRVVPASGEVAASSL